MHIERNLKLKTLQRPPSIQGLNTLKMEVLFILSISPFHSSKLMSEALKTLRQYNVLR